MHEAATLGKFVYFSAPRLRHMLWSPIQKRTSDSYNVNLLIKLV